jgi:hypothetical protein
MLKRHRLGPRHLLEGVKELLVAMQLVAGLGLPTGGRFQGSKEGARAVTHIIV